MTQPVVLLLPGLLCDDAVWAHQRRALAPHARTVVPDYGSLDTLDGMARHVLALAPAGRIAVVGHSMGARVALEAARLAPGRIERIALLDTGIDALAAGETGAEERAKRLALLQLAREQGMRAMGRQWARGMVHPSRIDTPVFDAILDMIERRTPEIFAAQIDALLNRADTSGVLAGLECPVLLMCGRQDAWSPLERHERMRSLQPRARLVVVEDAGHMTTMEQPDAVSRALLDFLR